MEIHLIFHGKIHSTWPFSTAEAATKSAAASGLPPYQAVEPTATAAARWG